VRFPDFECSSEWLPTTISQLVDKNWLYPPRDGNHGSIHPKSSDYIAQGIPFIMASDIKDGQIDIKGCSFISEEQANSLQKGFAREGDILLTHKGTVGAVALIPRITTPYLMLTPQVTYYRIKNQAHLSNNFLAQIFLSPTFQENLLTASGGGTRSYIGIIEQAKLPLVLPIDLNEQHQIADCLASIDALITAATQKLETLKIHKKGLMQQLFPATDTVEA
jgi:type I restriction enzyme S subunit